MANAVGCFVFEKSHFYNRGWWKHPLWMIVDTSCQRCSQLPFRQLTGSKDSGPYFHYSFPFCFFSITTFSYRIAARIKKFVYQNLTGVLKNIGFDPIPYTVGHFVFYRRCSIAGGERVPSFRWVFWVWCSIYNQLCSSGKILLENKDKVVRLTLSIRCPLDQLADMYLRFI